MSKGHRPHPIFFLTNEWIQEVSFGTQQASVNINWLFTPWCWGLCSATISLVTSSNVTVISGPLSAVDLPSSSFIFGPLKGLSPSWLLTGAKSSFGVIFRSQVIWLRETPCHERCFQPKEPTHRISLAPTFHFIHLLRLRALAYHMIGGYTYVYVFHTISPP